MPNRRSFTYCYDVPCDATPPTFGGRLLAHNVRLARKLLRAILKVRSLPTGTQVYRLVPLVRTRKA